MAQKEIQHNLKTGADNDIIFIREVTDRKSADFGKLKTSEGVYKFPYLSRSTGNSIKGTTETIESNELRKGRKKSAPRKGNSSAEGSLDIELSPTTFDDNLAAAFRDEWRRWGSDTDSKINLDKTFCPEGFFITRAIGNGEDYNPEENFGTRRLINDGKVGHEDGLIKVAPNCVIHELVCGEKDIKYSLLKKFGGVEKEDLYQEFKHMAINTLSLDVQIGAIVTGSFGFMGNNNPRLECRANFGGESKTRFVDGTTTGNSFVDNLPDASTDTDQFTSQIGALWVNGKQITFAESLSMELNNGLEKKFAIFVKDAISSQPLSLDITGELRTYLVEGESDELFNLGIDDATNEIMFAFQDKEEDPEFIYLFQIFKNKFGDIDLSASGTDTYDQTHPYSSFEERAVRVFRIALPKVREVEFVPDLETWTSKGKIVIRPNVEVISEDITGLSVKDSLIDASGNVIETKTITSATVNENSWIEVEEEEFTTVENAVAREITVSLNGADVVKSFAQTEAEAPNPVTDLAAVAGNRKTVITWTDSDSSDFENVIIDVTDNTGKSVSSKIIEKGVQTCTVSRLTNGDTYTVSAIAVDVNGNKSTVETVTVTPVAG